MMFDLTVKSCCAHTENINLIAECIEEELGIYGFRAGLAVEWCLKAKPGDCYDDDWGVHIRASASGTSGARKYGGKKNV